MTISELARRDLQLRDYGAIRDSYINEDGITDATHSAPHPLLTENLAKPNFDDAAKVEEYYRNVYVDNNFAGVHGLKGKYSKGKDKKGKGDYRDYSQQAKEKVTQASTSHTTKEKEKGNTAQDHTMSKDDEKATRATPATTVDPKKVITTTAEEKAKEKDQKENHHTTTFHHYHHTKEKGLESRQPKRRRKRNKPRVLLLRKTRTHF
eukprot:6471763-Amphidinium_carterae.4